jgi:DNA-directed RNA polymerase subunit RPC12/RpoP
MSTYSLLCPHCGRTSYSSATQHYAPCPYCGKIFSERGPDQRKSTRKPFGGIVTLRRGKSAWAGVGVDLSDGGIGVTLPFSPPLQIGERLEAEMPALHIRRQSRIIWIAQIEGDLRAGLEFLEQTSLSA